MDGLKARTREVTPVEVKIKVEPEAWGTRVWGFRSFTRAPPHQRVHSHQPPSIKMAGLARQAAMFRFQRVWAVALAP